MLLAVDTSTRYAGVALCDDGRVISTHCWYSRFNHTVELMPAVARILKAASLKPSELSGIAVALGPGGFSALRVGVSTVKALAFTAKKPVIGVGTLDLEAYPYLGSGVPVCAVLDAGRSELASALFGPDGQRTREDTIFAVPELVESLSNPIEDGIRNSMTDSTIGKTLICGEGVINWGELIREHLGSSGLVVRPAPASRLWALAEVGWERLSAGDTSDLATLQPYYLREPSIGGPKQRDRSPQQS